MLYDKLEETEKAEALPVFAVDRCIGGPHGGPRGRWQPVGLFRAKDLDQAIEKAAFALQRPSMLRATRLLL